MDIHAFAVTDVFDWKTPTKLTKLSGNKARIREKPTYVQEHTKKDVDIMRVVHECRSKKEWSKQRMKVKSFSQDIRLNRLRLHSSHGICHKKVKIVNTNSKEGRRKCALCGLSKSNENLMRNTTWMCSICEVPLCTTIFKGQREDCKTCFDRWHSCEDLQCAHQRSVELLHNSRGCRNK